MTDITRNQDAEAEYREHLQRSETVWNRWSDWYQLSERDFEPIRETLVGQLDLEPGDRVLEIGCGPGVNFSLLQDAVGDAGQVVAIDYSPEMVTKAEQRITANGWENVEIVRADATTADLCGPYDAAIATLALSIMPHVERALRNIHSALEVGSPLGVLDIQTFRSGAIRALNPLLRKFLRWYANWNVTADVKRAIDEIFGGFDQLGTHLLGSVYTLKATRFR